MINELKLKHLDLLEEDKINYANFMRDLDGFKKPFFKWGRRKRFIKSFHKVYNFIEGIKTINPTKVLLNKECKILFPDNIDNIPFIGMMSLQTLSNNTRGKKMSELIADTIAIVCFKEEFKNIDFDIDSKEYIDLKTNILNQPFLEMLGLYNHINKMIDASKTKWEGLFQSVSIFDEDYNMAGGYKMNNFNVILTINSICNDFGLTYKEAWQMPYGVTQTNSLAKATKAHIQMELSKIKEAKMRAQRKQS